MNCDDQRALLIHQAHAELGPAERAPLLGHLARCSGCALEYCRLLADLDGIQASLEEPPAALGRRVRAALEQELRPRGVRRLLGPLRRPIPVWALGAALLLPIALWAGYASDRSAATRGLGTAGAGSPSTHSAHAPPSAGSRPLSHSPKLYDAAGPPLAANPIL